MQAEKNTITIQGKEYPVVFTMKTVMNFEEIADKSFFGVDFSHIADRIALIAAAIYAADKDADVTVDSIMGDQDFKAMKDIIDAFTIVMKLSTKFFHIPEVEKELEPKAPPADEEEGEKPRKN